MPVTDDGKVGGKGLKWMGPTQCDLCQRPIKGILIDGRTQSGPWATMCKPCHAWHGYGLGTGRGQEYKASKEEPTVFRKVRG